MGLVDYSESDSSGSESEPPKAPPRAAPSHSKKPFQKVVDRSKPGRIVVNLPQTASEAKPSTEEPPAKRARTGHGGLFSGFNSFLPPPKNPTKTAPATSIGSRTRPGVNLRTSAAPGFSRDADDEDMADAGKSTASMDLPQPKTQPQPSIPVEQKAEEDVKLVGKPLMFRPLSVGRNPQKKKKKTPVAGASNTMPQAREQPTASSTEAKLDPTPASAPAPVPKKASLFSLHIEEPSEPRSSTNSGAYEPLFPTAPAADDHENQAYGDYPQYADHAQSGPSPTTAPGADSLGDIANDLNLSAADRRALFGRGGGQQAVKNVINFNMDKEYQHNEELRAAGEQQTHNPVRAIQGGKHSLRQLVQNVQNQREALEESFAKGRSNRQAASSRYGW